MRHAIPSLLIAVALLIGPGCREEKPNGVLFQIDLSGVSGGADELRIEGAKAVYPEDATKFSNFSHDSSVDQTSALIVLPDDWTETHVQFDIIALRDGIAVGGKSLLLVPPRGRVEDVPVTLQSGGLQCGNGAIDSWEICDGTDFGSATCNNAAGLAEGYLSCTPDCRLDVSACQQCGNGAIEGDENCEGSNLAGNTCLSIPGGFVGGTLRCDSATCKFDKTGCELGCGNGVVDEESGEECDGADLGGKTCADVGGFNAGTLACNDQCRFDTSGCSVCGNGLLEGDEACDGAAFGNQTCADFGYGPGQLTCVNCQVDTSNCCGDGEAGYLEDCDGADIGAETCSSVTYNLLPDGALACGAGCRFDISGCHNCGNRSIEGPEECDSDNLGGNTCVSLGLPYAGVLACSPDCTFDTSDCDICGTGYTGTGEECDDGNTADGDGCASDCTVETGWNCDTSVQPAVCRRDTCGDGNGTIDTNEVCDGANLGGETCLSQGYLQGTGAGLACAYDCESFDISGCTGGIVDSVSQIQAAIDEAYATGTHQTVQIEGGSYTPSTSFTLDECGGAACTTTPVGVTLEPAPGETVCFTPTGSFPVFDVTTGNNQFRNLCFDEVGQGFHFNAGDDGGGNLVRNCRFDNTTTQPDIQVWVESTGNQILANWFTSTTSSLGTRAIWVTDEGNTVAMNAISGPYQYAIQIGTGAGATAVTRIDHNSIEITGNLGGGGVYLLNAYQICYRNNIVYGDGTSTGLNLGALSFPGGTDCGGSGNGVANVTENHGVQCSDVSGNCAIYCNGSSTTVDLCDLTTNPGWSNDELCLSPGSNALIDSAVTGLGQAYDHDDSTPGVDYAGSGPDVGAREAGTTRTFGGVDSTCP